MQILWEIGRKLSLQFTDFRLISVLVALQFREVVSTTFTLERSRDGGWVKMYEEEAARSAGGVEAHLQQTKYV